MLKDFMVIASCVGLMDIMARFDFRALRMELNRYSSTINLLLKLTEAILIVWEMGKFFKHET